MTGYLTQRGQVGEMATTALRFLNREICNIIIERVLTLFRKEASKWRTFSKLRNSLTTCNASVERILTEQCQKLTLVRDNLQNRFHENFTTTYDWNSV